jgi:Flp pilus assembly protein TadD
LSRVIEQYPERAWGYHNLGCAYLDKVKDLDSAERAFEKALNLDPFFPRLRTQMGYARLMRGDFQGALLHYAEAIRINPNDGEAHLNRAIALEYLGEYNDALIEYRRFLEIPGEEIAGSRKMAREKLSGLSLLIK